MAGIPFCDYFVANLVSVALWFFWKLSAKLWHSPDKAMSCTFCQGCSDNDNDQINLEAQDAETMGLPRLFYSFLIIQ